MTRKDYELIARSIGAARLEHAGFDLEERAINRVVEQLGSSLAAENPNFNIGYFRAACRRETGEIANELEADGWICPAADLREGVPPETVMERVRKCSAGMDEANALAALRSLTKEANR